MKPARIHLLLAAIVLALGLLGWLQHSTMPTMTIAKQEDSGQDLGTLDNLLLIYAAGIARVSVQIAGITGGRRHERGTNSKGSYSRECGL